MNKLSKSQINTLEVLREHGSWMVSSQILVRGGSPASLPKLIEYGLIKKISHSYPLYQFQEWKII